MKVLVHLNRGIDKSYILHFGNKMTQGTIRKVRRLGPEDAARAVYGYAEILGSVRKIEIPREKKKSAVWEADAIVGCPKSEQDLRRRPYAY